MAIEYSDEDFDQDLQQDIAAAAAQAAGINMDSYDFGGFDSGGSDFTGASNQGVIDSIVNSYMDSPTRTGMAIRQSFPMFKSPRSGLNQFANLYTSRRGPMSRSDFNSLYDISRTNTGGIDTLGYDTAKALQRVGIGSGQVKTDPNVGRLTGTVFGKKNELGETVLMSDGKSMGIDAGDYYSGKSGSDVGRPDLETYQDKYGYADPTERAINRAYDQYLNPYNVRGERGYNRDIDPKFNKQAFDLRGQVRPGLQSGIFGRKDGTPTALGPIATYDRNYSGMDNIAMGVTGGMGMLARALTNKVTGIAGQPLPQDAMAPTPEMMARGETYGGLGRSFGQIPGQAVQGFKDAGAALRNVIDDFTTPNVPGVSTSSLDFMPRGASPDLAGFEQRFGGTNPLSGEAAPRGSLTPTELEGLSNATQNTVGEQLAGGFGIDTIGEAFGRGSVELSPEVQDFLDEHGMSVRDLMDKDFSKVPDGARLPSGQIMGPEFRPNQTSPAPATDLQQLIRDAVSSRELGSPLSGGIIQLAGATGGTDVTNMTQDERGMYRVGQDPSMIQKAFEALGLRERKARPSGQFYSPGKSRSFFENPVGYIFGS